MRLAVRQTERQTNTRTDTQADKHTDSWPCKPTGQRAGRQADMQTDRQTDEKSKVNTCRAHIAVPGALDRGADSGPWVWAIVPVDSVLFARKAVGEEIAQDHDATGKDMDRDGKLLAHMKLPEVIALIPVTRPELTIVDVLIVIVVPVTRALALCR